MLSERCWSNFRVYRHWDGLKGAGGVCWLFPGLKSAVCCQEAYFCALNSILFDTLQHKQNKRKKTDWNLDASLSWEISQRWLNLRTTFLIKCEFKQKRSVCRGAFVFEQQKMWNDWNQLDVVWKDCLTSLRGLRKLDLVDSFYIFSLLIYDLCSQQTQRKGQGVTFYAHSKMIMMRLWTAEILHM